MTAELRRILNAVATATACTAFVGVLVNATITRVWIVLTFGVALVGVALERCGARVVFRQARQKGHLQRRVVVVGTNPEALAVVRMLEEHPALGYDVVGLLECSTAYGVVPPVPVLGNWHEAVDIVREYDASGVVIATSAIDIPLGNRLTRELMELGYHVELTSGLVDISADRLIARPLGRRPVMHVEPVRRSGWRAAAKRAFDVALAGGALIVLSPVLAFAAIAIKLDSRGTVLFRQQRVGKGGKSFEVLKFRTMVPDAESMLANIRSMNDASGPLFKMRDDPRVTKVGRRLRAWSIDELPQLWNVLRGEMSIVGPRPALPSEAEMWSEELANRLSVKPGITGMWQVNGRSTSSFDDYVRYDLYYVDNWSLLTDLAIVAKTIPAVLLRKGAY
jgi:exopolysaccharide biosynthesis polyprenyl glycosylphosphotransferase